MAGVNVPTQTDFDALIARVTALEGQVTALQANVKVMPDNIKAQLKTVLEWMDANV